MIFTFISLTLRNFRICLMVVFLFTLFSGQSQTINDFGFVRSTDNPSVSKGSVPLRFPWAGGMNACQFSKIDLNQDGIKDLFVFDRAGNRILTFVHSGIPNTADYSYSPSYMLDFPYLAWWVRLVDYNCDGKEDLFTYASGGIAVYKNTSSGGNISFELVTNQLLSFMYTSYTNIFVTEVDYPAIDDLDGDGDLDILSFWIIGTYIHYQRNMSMEKYGHCDSLDYRLESTCWGYIREGITSNQVYLNALCPAKSATGAPVAEDQDDIRGINHIGSTLMTLDLNQDGLKDLLLGDVDYPTILGLVNGGTTDTARIISQDVAFPSYDTSIHLFSLPATFFEDVDHDGKRDLLVSPFDPNPLLTESDESVWMYENQGTDSQPDFHLTTKAFLQEEMIDAGTACFPVAVDVDQDGLMDLVLGNFGYHDSAYYFQGVLKAKFRSRLMVLHNTGTLTQPQFTLAQNDFASVSLLNLTNAYPGFGDIDGDGDIDMLLGNTDGSLFFFENTAGPGNPLAFAPPLSNYQGIDVGLASTPQLWDLDGDNLLDLIIGNSNGQLAYYQNTGTPQSPVFTWITDTLGGVDVRDPAVSWEGFSTPCFFRHNDTTRLFVGSLKGGIAYYKDIFPPFTGPFTEVSQNYLFLRDSERSASAVFDFDQDSFPDMVTGILNGGLLYFQGTSPHPAGIEETVADREGECVVYPNPAGNQCRVDVRGTEIHGDATYRIFNTAGQCVLRGRFYQFPASLTLPLPPGVYNLHLSLSRQQGNKVNIRPARLVVIR